MTYTLAPTTSNHAFSVYLRLSEPEFYSPEIYRTASSSSEPLVQTWDGGGGHLDELSPFCLFFLPSYFVSIGFPHRNLLMNEGPPSSHWFVRQGTVITDIVEHSSSHDLMIPWFPPLRLSFRTPKWRGPVRPDPWRLPSFGGRSGNTAQTRVGVAFSPLCTKLLIIGTHANWPPPIPWEVGEVPYLKSQTPGFS